MTCYRFCDLIIDSTETLPLPEAAACVPADIWLIRESDIEIQSSKSIHQWHEPDGSASLKVSHVRSGYLLEHADTARVEICAHGERVRYAALPEARSDYVTSALLNQTLPRILALRGALVIHASAVIFDGGLLLFAGGSGAGKSTIASSLAALGLRKAADDSVVLRRDMEGRICGIPTHNGASSSGDRGDAHLHARPILALYCLRGEIVESDLRNGTASQLGPTFERLSARDTVILLTKSAFILDPSNDRQLKSLFDRANSYASDLQAYDLRFPWSKSYLPELVRAVVDHGSSLDRRSTQGGSRS